ncbi:hypothetical protein CEXT_676611 [Caerostris extrusa]|uniref:Uncharacterized protein n=1 Tax=Caerostris extrusa TaxID=172846 RepID=A0AAV4Y6W9_CAEEX|nr:hypothetical protein CEXT_676611 [Caerostris extrusa]
MESVAERGLENRFSILFIEMTACAIESRSNASRYGKRDQEDNKLKHELVWLKAPKARGTYSKRWPQ